MKKVIALSAVLTLGLLGTACPETPTANNTNAKPATNASPAATTPAATTPAANTNAPAANANAEPANAPAANADKKDDMKPAANAPAANADKKDEKK